MILCRIGHQEFLIDEQYAVYFAQMMDSIIPVTVEYHKGQQYTVESNEFANGISMTKGNNSSLGFTRKEWDVFKNEPPIDPHKPLDDTQF